MGWLAQIFGLERDGNGGIPSPAPRAMSGGATEFVINSPADLEEALRLGNVSASGQSVTADSAMRVAAVFACVRIRAGAVANMPLGIKRRVDDRTRVDATDHPMWMVVNRRPNVWQKPAQFKRMMEAHVLLRGNAYAFKGRNIKGQVTSLTPLHPDRVEPRQLDDLTMEYIWTRKNGAKVTFKQDEILHLMGLSFDGIKGLSVIGMMREAVGIALAMESHGGTVFRNGANVTGALKLPAGRTLSEEQAEKLRGEMDQFRSGGAREGKVIVLEDGLEFQQMALSAEDAQWLEARKFSRGDIAMFFGVPPHMIGDTEKSTSWGTGIDAQSQGFVSYTLEDSLTAWEEAIGLDCLDWVKNPELYARFNRNALVRGDLKTRWEAYVKGLQWGVMSPNDVLAKEDENPREGGDIYYPPPNTAGKTGDGNVTP
ncbi:phage portal protein [Novosphingobium sp. KN65.2]|uniref:phage portal protein n=1 Tax=Novosphingobium sp. KN65.2 TaxID=1478134 RepID=UPI0005E5548F|nr:phage portal protein [Novosphingobium sp. KN65.2]CDO35006.1 Phage portal protein [Novosphingobium sp. KN65.2]